MQDEDEQFVYKGTTIDMTKCSLDFFGEDKAKMPPLSLISERFNAADVNTRWKIHVLVVVPESATSAVSAVPMFVVVDKNEDEEYEGVGMGVFLSPTLAVTFDHNLTAKHTVGGRVTLALKDDVMDAIEVVARNSELDFAILRAFEPRSFIAPWNGSPDALESRYDLVLASLRLGIDEYQAPYQGKLGFAPAACIAISHHKRHIMYSCPTYAGDSGAALVLKDGLLVGIHLKTINALREEIERKKVIKQGSFK
ncbi:Aste57867_1963 [Aphanomyces stellatus]|uniref:Aste57867_1963 protein n=1 Tax=Aphanomyces stellatus TaxID=120398 RepID=A0A485K920_9STRA|nr:hypothetical protein As57867_001961 [Aphanomyces stellatus]VFT79168.1 Aste57867_1963 [Aphanomyces stellatus]